MVVADNEKSLVSKITGLLENEDYESDIILNSLLKEVVSKIEHLEHVIDRDRYVVAAGIKSVETSIKAREWTLTGRGPYEWDDDDYRKEFGIWMDETYSSLAILRKVAWDKSDCTTDSEKIDRARKAALEIMKRPLGHREMIAADIGLFDPRDSEIVKLKNQLLEAQIELTKYKPNYDNGFCNKCGYFGKVEGQGFHQRPNGTDCHYQIVKTIPVDKLTSEFINISIETTVMMCKALGSIDPNLLISTLQQRMKFDCVIEVLQCALERNQISYNPDGFVVAVP